MFFLLLINLWLAKSMIRSNRDSIQVKVSTLNTNLDNSFNKIRELAVSPERPLSTMILMIHLSANCTFCPRCFQNEWYIKDGGRQSSPCCWLLAKKGPFTESSRGNSFPHQFIIPVINYGHILNPFHLTVCIRLCKSPNDALNMNIQCRNKGSKDLSFQLRTWFGIRCV